MIALCIECGELVEADEEMCSMNVRYTYECECVGNANCRADDPHADDDHNDPRHGQAEALNRGRA